MHYRGPVPVSLLTCPKPRDAPRAGRWYDCVWACGTDPRTPDHTVATPIGWRMLRGALFTRHFLEEASAKPMRTGALPHSRSPAMPVRSSRCGIRNRARADLSRARPARLAPLPHQEPARDRHDVADALLFLSFEARERARRLPAADRFRHGAVVVENEACDTALDRASAAARRRPRSCCATSTEQRCGRTAQSAGIC